MLEVKGSLYKLYTELVDNKVIYKLNIDNKLYNINDYINNSQITIEFLEQIICIACQKNTNKSFNQGYCFPCFRTLASCDRCIMSPEHCHFHLGTCREPQWALQHCMQDHVVYLANSSGLKVGITRASQLPTRWIDQGASQGLVIARVATRYQAGLLEVICKQHLNDRTDWRAMLKSKPGYINLHRTRDELYNKIQSEFIALQVKFDTDQQKLVWCDNNTEIAQQAAQEQIQEIEYPVQSYPDKISSLNLDKDKKIFGRLLGIKGQYLILDKGVINLRKYTGYQVKVAFAA